MSQYSDGWKSDDALLQAIEAVTGGTMDHEPETCGSVRCDGRTPDNCQDPAVALWRDGGREDELAAYLDEHTPGWRNAGLYWGDYRWTGE
jgi:hypothetical protein